MMKKTFFYLLAAAVALTAASCSDSDNPNPEPNPEAPTYKVGDLYESGGVKGIVYQVAGNGKSGMIFSMGEEECLWKTVSDQPETSDMNNGMNNMELVKSAGEGWQELCPAFAWCDALNTGGVTGWYLPAANELAVLFKVILEGGDAFNRKIWAYGAEAVQSLGYVSSSYTGETNKVLTAVQNEDGTVAFLKDEIYGENNKHSYLRSVRAVRAFVSGEEPQGTPSTERMYRVGEAYSVNGVEGIVFLTSDHGRHGMILSNAQGKAVCSLLNDEVDAKDSYDGEKNMEAVRALADWQTNYPAFGWCEGLNTNGVTGWYLPAWYELAKVSAAYQYNIFFKEAIGRGGVTALDDASYWDSVMLYSDRGHYTNPVTGANGPMEKSTELNVRAVRKF